MKRRSLILAAHGAVLSPLAALPRFAIGQPAFPNHPLRYIVPVPAGGGSDMVGRAVCDRWGRALGQQFIVDNLGGGGGVIACQTTVKSAPDGYTMMQGYVATHGTSPATRRGLPYDPIKDFTPIGMIGGTPNLLVVNAAVPAKNFAEFVAWVKANPGKVGYGSSGPGSLTHLTMELLKQQVGITDMTHVPYRGIAPAFTDLMGGQTQAMFPGLAAALPQLTTGKVRAIAVTGAKRATQLPEVPTLDELGLKGFDAMQWYGVTGPSGLHPDVLAKLNETLNTVLKQPDFKDKLSTEAVQPMPMSPTEFAQYIKDDIARWTAVAKARNIVLDA